MPRYLYRALGAVAFIMAGIWVFEKNAPIWVVTMFGLGTAALAAGALDLWRKSRA